MPTVLWHEELAECDLLYVGGRPDLLAEGRRQAAAAGLLQPPLFQ